MCDAEIWLFNSFKIIQQRLFTTSLFTFLSHRKEQTGKVSMFYFSTLGKVFVWIRFQHFVVFSAFSSFCTSFIMLHTCLISSRRFQNKTDTWTRDLSLHFACLFLLGYLPARDSVLSCLTLKQYSIVGNLQIIHITVPPNVFRCLKRVNFLLFH